jgi:peptidoglycan/LPS O-acetylase OafA/YrhL
MFIKLNELLFGLRTHKGLQIDALDGVRGLAVLFVLFSHAANRNLVFNPDFKFAGTGSGQMGVYLFFGLSAFLLTRNLISRENSTLRTYRLWVDYIVRRVLRIFPLFTAVLLTIWAASGAYGRYFLGKFDLPNVWQHIILREGKAHLWTIGAEVRFYFVLPFLVLFFVFIAKRSIKITTLVTIGTLAFTSYYFSSPNPKFAEYRFIALFLTGSCFATINEWYHSREKKLSSKIMTVIGVLCLLAMLFYMPNTYALLFGKDHHFFNARLFPLWGSLFCLFIFVVINDSGWLNRFFSHKLMRWIGIISFSVYLWHLFILKWAVTLDLHIMLKLLIFYGGTLIFGTVSFLIFERPLSKVRVYRVESKTSTAQPKKLSEDKLQIGVEN